MTHKHAIILLGSPGSGKTSIAHRLAAHDQIEFIETGQLLRDEVENESELGKKFESYLQSGKLAPTELVVQVLNKRIKGLHAKVIVFDGSPRRETEINPFFRMMNENGIFLLKVIILQIDREVAFKRLTGRRICQNCGRIYNVYYNPPQKMGVCDECNNQLEQREDDRPEIVNRRIDEFEKNTAPVIQYFRKNFSEKILEVDAEKPIEQVFSLIWTQIMKFSHKN